MNKFITTNLGGLPFRANDLRWIDDSVRDSFKALLAGFGASMIIFQGCTRTEISGTVTITEGYVGLQGEIFYVPLHTFPAAVLPDLEYWQIITIDDPQGTKLFKDGSTKETYQIRIAKVVPGSTGIGEYTDSERFYSLVRRSLPKSSWHTFSTQIVPPGDLIPGTYRLRCYKDIDGFVHLEGLRYNEDQDTGIIANLPVLLRPTVPKRYAIHTLNTPTQIGQSIIDIHTNGNIEIVRAETGSAVLMDFSQIPPFEGV
jgi:hypothetical protein